MTAWARTGAPELRELAAAGAVAVWPVGATEQHGAHLVTGFDLASATAVCEQAAAQARSLVVLPGMPFGSSDHWLPLGATLSLRAATLIAVVADVARSLARSGFRRLVIVNGHAGNVGPLGAALAGAGTEDLQIEAVSYWQLVPADVLADACLADGGANGHAGEVETSIALYLGGLAVDEGLPGEPGAPLSHGAPGARTGTFLRVPRPAEESPNGVYGDPRPARAELGRLVIEQAAAALAAHCDAVLDGAAR